MRSYKTQKGFVVGNGAKCETFVNFSTLVLTLLKMGIYIVEIDKEDLSIKIMCHLHQVSTHKI